MSAVVDRPDVSPPSRAPRRSWLPILWTLPPVLAVLGIAGYPILRVLTESTRTPTGRGTEVWTSVLGSEAFREALWRTVSIAVCATAGCFSAPVPGWVDNASLPGLAVRFGLPSAIGTVLGLAVPRHLGDRREHEQTCHHPDGGGDTAGLRYIFW
ncbi:hypothetical protein ACTWPB_16615 [Nocardia sp. IBHARD005]|uniref:hypothetical protein n=1 Tax=Nocardia sp. IBHARD005 TaxID=3457765 RepID=UPI00405A01BA